MAEPAVLYTAEDGVASLTLNRPQVLNALNGELLDGLRDGLARAKADPAVRALLLTGAGRGFCAGADLAAASATTRSCWRCAGCPNRSSPRSTARPPVPA